MASDNQQAPVSPVVTIPGYKIIEVLGKGGMAIVYLAIQESIGRKVALKILAPDHSDESFTDRFLREARIISQLTHPNIITIFDAGVHQGYHYMCMEYIPGKNLTQERDRLSRKQKIKIIKQIALALDYAGKKGYIHRDIKPENIMMHEDGRAILTDFGIARGQDVTRGLTQTGKAIGTPYFMSPEQTKGLKVDHRSDIYSLGVVLFQAISGHVPFDGPSLVAIGIKHLSEPIPILPPGMEIFQPIINKCMTKEPEHRYQSAAELYHALNNINEAQLDFLEAKAKALGNAQARHHTKTQHAQNSIEILANTQANTLPPHDQVPRIRAQRVSNTLKNDETKKLKNHNRQRRIWLILILLLATGALAYYKQTELITFWQQRLQPVLSQYLPSQQATPATTITQTVARKHGNKTQKALPHNTPVQASTPTQAPAVTPAKSAGLGNHKNPSEITAEILQYRKALRLNPDDIAARQGIDQDRQQLRQLLHQALINKDTDTAREILATFRKSFPRLRRLPIMRDIEQRINRIDQFNAHMEQARVYMAANAIAKPDGANALEEYLAASQIYPNDPQVKSGLQHIAHLFYQAAKSARSSDQYASAMNNVVTGLEAVKNDPQLLALQHDLQSDIHEQAMAKQMLQQADQLMQKNQVLDPDTGNAYQLYRNVLHLEPQNQSAKAGMRQVRLWLVSHIQGLYDKKQYLQAQALLKRAQSYFPTSTLFKPLQGKIDKAIDATYPKITRIEFGSSPITAPTGQTNLDNLSPGKTLYAAFDFKNFYTANTLLIARLKDLSGKTVYAEQPFRVAGRAGQGHFALQIPKPGNRDGNYSVEIYMDTSQILKAKLSGLQ